MNKHQECWFCGATPTDPWRSQAWDEDEPRDMPMCRRHGDATREALRLRGIGEHDAADMTDSANGIETRTQFNCWAPPVVEQHL